MLCSGCGKEAGAGVLCPACGALRDGPVPADAAAAAYAAQGRALAGRGDVHAALDAFDCAIDLYRALARARPEPASAPVLAEACIAKADLLAGLGDSRTAAVLYAQAAETIEPLVTRSGRRDLEEALAISWTGLAWQTWELHQDPGVLPLLDRAVALWRRLVESEGRSDLAPRLGDALGRRARVAEFA